MASDRIELGKRGEALAERYLIDRGYEIVDRNWHCRYGEVDIIASLEHCIVFVEVRTRRSNSTEQALASITPQKQERMLKAVYEYLSATYPDSDGPVWRIDVIAVALLSSGSPIIDHVEDALGW